MVAVTVSSAGKPPAFARKLPITVNLASEDVATVADLKAAIAEQIPKFYSARQKITLKGDRKALSDEAKLRDVGIVGGSEVSVKDLGAQIAWRTVFLTEYAGPLFIHSAIYYCPKIFYGRSFQHSTLQNYVYAFIMLHYLKRELETIFVHRFSHGTMPWFNIFKNSGHYWITSGVLLALDIYRPKFSATSGFIRGTYRDEPKFLYAFAIFFAWAELSNLSTHLTLRSLRPAGTKRRAIPYGYGFSFPGITCPNYFFESLAWLSIAAITNSLAAWIFLAFSAGQMAIWAAKKHRNYKKEFGKDYPKRSAMIPFLF